jgi:hypothetical protein
VGKISLRPFTGTRGGEEPFPESVRSAPRKTVSRLSKVVLTH